MDANCTNNHYSDHVQANGLTPAEEQRKELDLRAKTFEELAIRLGEFESPRMFARWLDEHGYKTFPDMPDYIS